MVFTASSITPRCLARTPSPSRGGARTLGAGEAPTQCSEPKHCNPPTLLRAVPLQGSAPQHTPPCGFSLYSPFEVKVGTECGNQKVRAWGPGLEGGVVGKSADFVVEAIGDDVGTLGELGATAWAPWGPLPGSRALMELVAVDRLLRGGPVAGQDRMR